MSTFCQRSYRRGVGGQKSQNLVNVVCERPLRRSHSAAAHVQLTVGHHNLDFWPKIKKIKESYCTSKEHIMNESSLKKLW